jgi:hypothetical protein
MKINIIKALALALSPVCELKTVVPDNFSVPVVYLLSINLSENPVKGTQYYKGYLTIVIEGLAEDSILDILKLAEDVRNILKPDVSANPLGSSIFNLVDNPGTQETSLQEKVHREQLTYEFTYTNPTP